MANPSNKNVPQALPLCSACAGDTEVTNDSPSSDLPRIHNPVGETDPSPGSDDPECAELGRRSLKGALDPSWAVREGFLEEAEP